jgi:hypothetical protein
MGIEQDAPTWGEVVDTTPDGLDHSDTVGAGGKWRRREGIAETTFEHLLLGTTGPVLLACERPRRRVGRLVGKLGEFA